LRGVKFTAHKDDNYQCSDHPGHGSDSDDSDDSDDNDKMVDKIDIN
jgi:hypothetical protein